MSRTGTIAVIDPEQGAAAIRTAEGEYTIVEIDPDWALGIGDRIAWDNDDGLGFETYRNESRSADGDVFVQNHYVDEKTMRLQFPG
ncbi:MAG: hypothetical protein ACOY82_20690 [Pseudomonadota bacterium]